MKTLFLSILVLFSFNAANALSLAAPAAPDYCFGVNQENHNDEVELLLVDHDTYSLGGDSGIFYHINNTGARVGAIQYWGTVSGIYFAGSGSQSWSLSLTFGMDGLEGRLTLTTNAWNPGLGMNSGSQKVYNMICE